MEKGMCLSILLIASFAALVAFAADAADFSGVWTATIVTAAGQKRHTYVFRQSGPDLIGTSRSDDGLVAISNGNINYKTGHGIFEATHGTAPKYADQDKVNPSSVILSGVMMLDHIGWGPAARLIDRGISRAIAQKRVTYDFHRLTDGATLLRCSEFGDAIIENMD